MNNITDQINAAFYMMKHNVPYTLGIIAILWIIHYLNYLSRHHFNRLGIYPRRFFGLRGIIFSPFLHGHADHLFFNTIPLFILLNFVMIYGMPTFYCVTLIIMLLGGMGIWLFARPAYHIGASTLILGYWGYLLLNAWEQGTVVAIILGLVCVYYFGSLLFSLFPSDEKSSWEGHLFGFLAGIAANYICPLIHNYIMIYSAHA